MLVYCIHNSINGKNYIGQTVSSLEERLYQHVYKGSKCKYLKRAIDKYGKDNFYIFEIDSAFSLEELYNKETYWINKYNSFDSSMGYNLRKSQKGKGSLNSQSIKLISENTKVAMQNLDEDKKFNRKEKSRLTQIEKGIYKRVGEQRSKNYLGNKNPRAKELWILDQENNCIEKFNTFKEFTEKYKIGNSIIIKHLISDEPFSKTILKGYKLYTPKPLKKMNRKEN